VNSVPALGSWVVADLLAVAGKPRLVVWTAPDTRAVVVDCTASRRGGQRAPWPRDWGSWLPGWSGYGSTYLLSEIRPATPEEVQAAQLDQLAGAGL
jgi:hypothetical protein